MERVLQAATPTVTSAPPPYRVTIGLIDVGAVLLGVSAEHKARSCGERVGAPASKCLHKTDGAYPSTDSVSGRRGTPRRGSLHSSGNDESQCDGDGSGRPRPHLRTAASEIVPQT